VLATFRPSTDHLLTSPQRCFQLNGGALVQLLGSCCAGGALPSLRCLAMSHLDLVGLDARLAGSLVPLRPGPLVFAADAGGGGGGGGGVPETAAAVAGMAVPQTAVPVAAVAETETAVAVPRAAVPQTAVAETAVAETADGSGSAPETVAAPKCAGGPTTGLTLLALHNCTGLGAAGLRSLAEACPRLEVRPGARCGLLHGVEHL
jgi:hypothetical protein